MTIPILSIVGVRYGVPDIGLLGAREFADAYRDMLAVTDLPALVDAENATTTTMAGRHRGGRAR